MYCRMESLRVVCKPTMWFKSRAIGMGLLLLGFGCYFFYDASIGYPEKNAHYVMYRAFESAGQAVEGVPSQDEWTRISQENVIHFPAQYPVPASTGSSLPWPQEMVDFGLMKQGWNEAWTVYTTRLKLPLKPVDFPFDAGKITEQWVAGGISCALGVLCFALLLRTLNRRMAIEGDRVTAAGRTFPVARITRLDMRKWKHKGIAYALLEDGRRIRLDGFCYGGFAKNAPSPHAEDFMKALISVYRGEILDFEEA